MLNQAGSPTVTNCTFTGNHAFYNGGAVCNREGSQAFFKACTFTTNDAGAGGGMRNIDSAPLLVDCTFLDNRAGAGGAMDCLRSQSTLRGCTMAGNEVAISRLDEPHAPPLANDITITRTDHAWLTKLAALLDATDKSSRSIG